MVLADTSVWVDDFQRGPSTQTLDQLLVSQEAATHPMVVAELACGSPPAPRLQTLSRIENLDQVRQASLAAVRELLEHKSLYGRGLGLVDLVLLASTCLTAGARWYTLDKPLMAAASDLGVLYEPAMH